MSNLIDDLIGIAKAGINQIGGPQGILSIKGPTSSSVTATGTPVRSWLDPCPNSDKWSHYGILGLMAVFVLFGILGVLFGNGKADTTIIEASSA